MSYYDIYARYKDFDFESALDSVPREDVEFSIARERLEPGDFLRLLSPAAEGCLEEMAQKAHEVTLRYFGRTMQLYTPIYLSNYCDNECAYCGFNAKNDIARRKLSLDEVEKEAKAISITGLKHVLVLTGESRRESPLSYIKECVGILSGYFSSVAVEIYPLTEDEYGDIVSAGADGLTIYQELYDEKAYSMMHRAGPKRDYRFRLDAPERGARAGMRGVNIGVLLGLDDWRREAFFMGLHAKYLQDNFADVEIGASIPRLRPQVADFKARAPVADKDIAQIIVSLRLFLPRLGIALSTRESPELRENLVGLGITRMSAGSTTRVGGHTIETIGEDGSSQFEISDRRSVREVMAMLEKRGYQPVLKDWVRV